MADDAPSKKVLLINSDNCSSQYKCAQHFAKLQDNANTKDAIIIRIWSIAGRGKGEVDHVGGLAKVSIRRAIAGGHLIKTTDEMIDCRGIKIFRENPSTLRICQQEVSPG